MILIIIASVFLLIVAVGIILLVFIYQKKQIHYVREKEQLKTDFEKQILESKLEIQEQTFTNISQEIHDNIGGTLSLAKLNLNTIPPEQLNGAAEKIANTKELVTKAISDLRTLSKTLHSEAILAVGLIKAIEMELKLLDKTEAFQTSLSITGTPADIDRQKELILFRTVQEALNNAIKHSEATLIKIKLDYIEDEMRLTILDNGKGFNKEEIEADSNRGSGLRNMQNRTRMIGGELSINGTSGTEIQISLPIIAP